MSDKACIYDGTGRQSDGTAGTDHWLDERPVLEASLPRAMARTMTRFYDAGTVETMTDFVAATRAGVGGGGIAVEDLCHTDGETSHRPGLTTRSHAGIDARRDGGSRSLGGLRLEKSVSPRLIFRVANMNV
jgi:hypothetical protein